MSTPKPPMPKLVDDKTKLTGIPLSDVFNANPAKVEEFFTKPFADKKMVLTKTSYREEYFSNKLQKSFCFRHWKAVSPLQAAALSGDNFLVMKLLGYIIQNDELRLDALQQLQDVFNRKDIKAHVETTRNTPAAPATAAAAPAPASAAATITNNKNDVKANAELSKIKAENTEIEFADAAEYLAPINALLKAYADFIDQFPTLYSQEKWKELDKLWGQVGECQRRLPRYILQEFCDKKPFNFSLPRFSTEPSREECRNGFDELLDALGNLTLAGLYCGAIGQGARGAQAIDTSAMEWLWRVAQLDRDALNHLCQLRQEGLKNIIDCLQTPQSALTLLSDDRGVGPKPR